MSGPAPRCGDGRPCGGPWTRSASTCAAVGAPDVPDLPGIEAELVAAVRFHRIAPLAHVALRGSPDPTWPPSSARTATRAHAPRAGHRVARGDQPAPWRGCPWVTFKGPVLSETLHPVAGLRSYGDLDLLVAPADLREACERLLARRLAGPGVAGRPAQRRGDRRGGARPRPAARSSTCTGRSLLSQTLRRRFPVPTADLRRPQHAAGDRPGRGPHARRHRHAGPPVPPRRDVGRRTPGPPARRRPGGASDPRLGPGRQPRPVLGCRRAGRSGARPGPARPGHAGAARPRPPARPLPCVREAHRPPSTPRGRLAAVRGEASWPRLVARAARPSATATASRALQNAVLGAVNRARPAPAQRPAARADARTSRPGSPPSSGSPSPCRQDARRKQEAVMRP